MERRGLRQGQLTEPFGLLAEKVQGGKEALGGRGVEGTAAGFDRAALAVGVEVAESFAIGQVECLAPNPSVFSTRAVFASSTSRVFVRKSAITCSSR